MRACGLDSIIADVIAVVLWISRQVAAQPADWLTAASTALLMIIAAVQLRAINRTSAADFVHRLNGDFYTPHTRNIRELLVRDALEFEGDEVAARFCTRDRSRIFEAQEIDDYVLGPLEAIGIYERRGIIDLGTTYEMFGWYVTTIWESSAVQAYIEWQKKQPRSFDVYDGLEELYRKCTDYRAQKELNYRRPDVSS